MTRNRTLDGAKLSLVFLVVFGHMFDPLVKEMTGALTHQEAFIKTIYMGIYAFHMPAFVMLCGMVASSELNRKQIEKLFTKLLLPLVIFTLFYEVLNIILNGHISQYTIKFKPYWILWFLVSLFIWKLLLPLFVKVRYPVSLSIFVAVLVGYVDFIGAKFGLSRTLYFFPFFLLGHRLSAEFLSRLQPELPKKIMAFSLIAFVFGLSWIFTDLSHKWLYGSYSFSELEVSGWQAGASRFGLITLSTITSLSFLLLIASYRFSFYGRGVNTLYVFLWHGFFIKCFDKIGFIDYAGQWPLVIVVPVFLMIALFLTFTLSSEYIARRSDQLIFKPLENLFTKTKSLMFQILGFVEAPSHRTNE